MKASNKKVKDKKIKVVRDLDNIEDMTVEEVLETFNFSEEPLLKNVIEIRRRMDCLELIVDKTGFSAYSDYYNNVHGYWVFDH